MKPESVRSSEIPQIQRSIRINSQDLRTDQDCDHRNGLIEWDVISTFGWTFRPGSCARAQDKSEYHASYERPVAERDESGCLTTSRGLCSSTWILSGCIWPSRYLCDVGRGSLTDRSADDLTSTASAVVYSVSLFLHRLSYRHDAMPGMIMIQTRRTD